MCIIDMHSLYYGLWKTTISDTYRYRVLTYPNCPQYGHVTIENIPLWSIQICQQFIFFTVQDTHFKSAERNSAHPILHFFMFVYLLCTSMQFTLYTKRLGSMTVPVISIFYYHLLKECYQAQR